MENHLILRCINCGRSLGAFSPEKIRYRCDECGHIYTSQEGVIDFLSPANGGASSRPHIDHLSSFACPAPNRSYVAELDLRLQPLYSKVFRDYIKKPSMFLDVGCGFGSLLATASERFDLVVGVNTDYAELRSAGAWLERCGIRNALLMRASAQKLPFMPGQFLAVACVQVLEHLLNPEIALAELRLMLAAGGGLYLSLPNRYTLRREPHVRLWGIGFLPRRASLWYASRLQRLEEFNSVNLLSARQVSGWMRHEFGSSFEMIRSGYHRSPLGRLAKRLWHVPFVSSLARHMVADIEVIAWR